MSVKWPNECPKCKAAPGENCRALTTGRVTDTHRARLDDYHENSYLSRLLANQRRDGFQGERA